MKTTERLAHLNSQIKAKMVNVSVDDGVATVQLNPPTKLVFLSEQLSSDLNEVLLELEKVDSVKVVILTGRGNSFCTGASIHEIRSSTQKSFFF